MESRLEVKPPAHHTRAVRRALVDVQRGSVPFHRVAGSPVHAQVAQVTSQLGGVEARVDDATARHCSEKRSAQRACSSCRQMTMGIIIIITHSFVGSYIRENKLTDVSSMTAPAVHKMLPSVLIVNDVVSLV